MGSQIEQLPDLSGYLKLASSPGWQRVYLRCPSRQPHRESERATARILKFRGAVSGTNALGRSAVPPDQQPTAAHDGFEPE